MAATGGPDFAMFDLDLTHAQRLTEETVCDFAHREIVPRTRDRERAGEPDPER